MFYIFNQKDTVTAMIMLAALMIWILMVVVLIIFMIPMLNQFKNKRITMKSAKQKISKKKKNRGEKAAI